MATVARIRRDEAEQARAEGVGDLGGVSYEQFCSRWASREKETARARRISRKRTDPEMVAALRRLWAA